MFLRLLWESFARQRRRKALAGIAILLGTTAVSAMLSLATSIGDRIHRELAVYGANLIVYPKADLLEVKVGGVSIKPTSGGAYLKESSLEKLKGIFWANNITGVSPELATELELANPELGDLGAANGTGESQVAGPSVAAVGLWFHHGWNPQSGTVTGAPELHPWWKIEGAWPASPNQVVLGRALSSRLGVHRGDLLRISAVGGRASKTLHEVQISGLVASGDDAENEVLMPLQALQSWANLPDAVSRVEVSARTRPEDAFARLDPDKLPAKQHEIWYCRPYANSIAYQIREAIPGSDAEQVRRVEQSEGTVLARISGLMWLVSGAALLAAGFAVSAAMATAVMERRREIGLMRSLGASKGAIALLFYMESGLLALGAGTVGYLAGSGLAYWLGGRIFSGNGPGGGTAPLLNLVLLPVVLAMALLVSFAGSTPSIRGALAMDASAVLRVEA